MRGLEGELDTATYVACIVPLAARDLSNGRGFSSRQLIEPAMGPRKQGDEFVVGGVPPFYLIRATNGFFAAAGDVLFTAKEAKCFPETAFGFVCLPSARLSARQEVRRVHGDPGGIFIATREPSNGTQRCSGREPLVPMMEPADLWKRHDLSDAVELNRSPLGGVLAQR